MIKDLRVAPSVAWCLPTIASTRVLFHRSNAILVPRGPFYESLLNQTLGGPDSRLQFPALRRVTVQANQFATDGPLTLDAYLNGRPIQQVMSGNVTLAEAQWFADQLTANRSHEGSAFLLSVHREFYTMGFDPAVIALTPNAVVANSGNFSAPAPVKEWWELIWNAVAGFASAVWNAAVAVAMFFVALGQWLVDAVVGLVIGLATGDWTYFQDKVVKPFVEAMSKLIQFIIDLATAVFDAIVSLVLWGIDALIGDALRWMARALSVTALSASGPGGSSGTVATVGAGDAVIGPVLAIFVALAIGIRGVEAVISAVTMGLGWLISKVLSKTVADLIIKTLAHVAMALTITAVFGEILASIGWIEKATVDFVAGAGVALGVIATIAELVFKVAGGLFTKTSKEPSILRRFGGFALSLFGLLIAIAGASYNTGPVLLAFDVIAAFLSLAGFVLYVTDSKNLENKAADAISPIGRALEESVVYGSLPVAGLQIGLHLAQGKYRESPSP